MTLRVGVIGTGWVATARHIPAFSRHPGSDVVAVFDRKPDRASDTADRFGIRHATSSLDELFEHGLDAVSICTPPWTHAELAIDALGRGVHVFTEKPMAMNAREAESMVAASVAASRTLCVSHNFAFSRAVRRADRLLAGAAPVTYATGLQLSSSRRRLPDWYQQLPAGLLMDEVPHLLYTLRHFLGPFRVDGVRGTIDSATGLPSTTEVQLGAEGAMGHITMLFDTPVSEWHVGLVTGERVIDLDLFRDIAIDIGSDRQHKPADILRTSARALGLHAYGFVTSGARYATRRQFWGHDTLIAAFIDAVAAGQPSPVPVEESVEVVRLLDAIIEGLGLTP